jgi:hypothetical protein
MLGNWSVLGNPVTVIVKIESHDLDRRPGYGRRTHLADQVAGSLATSLDYAPSSVHPGRWRFFAVVERVQRAVTKTLTAMTITVDLVKGLVYVFVEGQGSAIGRILEDVAGYLLFGRRPTDDCKDTAPTGVQDCERRDQSFDRRCGR